MTSVMPPQPVVPPSLDSYSLPKAHTCPEITPGIARERVRQERVRTDRARLEASMKDGKLPPGIASVEWLKAQEPKVVVDGLRGCARGGWMIETCGHGYQRKFPKPCKTWTCPDCYPRKLAVLTNRLGMAMQLSRERGTFLKFITLTWANDVDAVRAGLDFQHFVQSMRRLFPNDGFQYVKVSEYTENGRLHIHIAAITPYMWQHDMSRQWEAHSGASIVYVEAVRSVQKMRNYLAKYLSKGPVGKVSYSRDFPKLPVEGEIGVREPGVAYGPVSFSVDDAIEGMMRKRPVHLITYSRGFPGGGRLPKHEITDCDRCGVRHTFEWERPIRGKDVGASSYEVGCDCWDGDAAVALIATMPLAGVPDDVPDYYGRGE